MNITEERIDTQSAFLKIKINPSDYNSQLDEALKKYRRQVAMPGFRQGKVPLGIVKNRYGKALLAEEINKMLNNGIQNYIRDNKLNVLGSPLPSVNHHEQGDWENPGDFEFVYELGLAPELNVEIEKSDKITFYTIRVDDEMVEERIQQISKRYGEINDVDTISDTSIMMGDLIELDQNDEIKPGGIMKSSTVFMESVTEDGKQKLLGLKVGDPAILNPNSLTANHDELGRMLGITHQQVHHLHTNFRYNISIIKEIKPAELNQELFDKYYGEGQVSSSEEFKTRLKKEISDNYINESNILFRRDLAQMLLQKFNPNLPDNFMKRWILATNEKPITTEQLDFDYPNYRKSLQWELIMNQLIGKKAIEVHPDEVLHQAMDALAGQYAQYGMPRPDEEELRKSALNMLGKEENARGIYDRLYNEKLIALGRERANVSEKEVSFAEFVAMAEREPHRH
jgi:trigger factor